MENNKKYCTLEPEKFKRLLNNEMHKSLIIVNIGTDEHPDYVIEGTDLVVKNMITMLYE